MIERVPARLALLAALMVGSACGGPADEPVRSGPTGGEDRGPTIIARSELELRALATSMARDPAVWAPMPGLDPPAHLLGSDTVTVWFTGDLTQLDSLGLGTVEPWVAGVAAPGDRIIALRIDGPQRNLSALRAVYRHEVAHVMLHAATGGNIPRWFQEGYAQAASGTWNWNDGWRLQFLLVRRGQAVLAGLDQGFRLGFDPPTAYLLSYTAVAALHEMAGAPGFAALFAELRSGKSFEEALRSVYGLTGRDFENRWRRQVLDRYGWLYLFSRTGLIWLAVAGLVLAMGISRVRRDRDRLARMLAEEAAAESEQAFNVDELENGV